MAEFEVVKAEASHVIYNITSAETKMMAASEHLHSMTWLNEDRVAESRQIQADLMRLIIRVHELLSGYELTTMADPDRPPFDNYARRDSHDAGWQPAQSCTTQGCEAGRNTTCD